MSFEPQKDHGVFLLGYPIHWVKYNIINNIISELIFHSETKEKCSAEKPVSDDLTKATVKKCVVKGTKQKWNKIWRKDLKNLMERGKHKISKEMKTAE